MIETFSLLNRTLTLNRYPIRQIEKLQAWDAGDEYLINYLTKESTRYPLTDKSHLLIIGDNFGALSSWFSPICQVTMVSDSLISQKATKHNIKNNHLPVISIQDSLTSLPVSDVCIMRLPKSKRLLTWHLIQLCQQMPDGMTIITTAKAKDIHTSTLKLFEKYLGITQTSLAVKKARLIFTKVDKSKQQLLPEPLTWPVPEHNLILTNHANVFSGERLDLGARFMLEHIPQDHNLKHIIDLGCGNGILGIKAAQLNPQAKITCIDESFMAIASAQENANLNLKEKHHLTAQTNNALDKFPKNSADLILCNPPFHQQNTITDHIAWQMFQDASVVLKKGGKLRIVANTHLKYQEKLRRLFGTYKKVASNKKFIIIEVEK